MAGVSKMSRRIRQGHLRWTGGSEYDGDELRLRQSTNAQRKGTRNSMAKTRGLKLHQVSNIGVVG